MPEIIIVLLVLALASMALILLGHGIWVFLAFAFRGFKPKKAPQQTCVFCGAMTPADDNKCHWCGKDVGSPLATELCDLAAVLRQLRRFRSNGALKPETADQMLQRVTAYRERLLHPAALRQEAAEAQPASKPAPAAAPALPPRPYVVAVEVVEERSWPAERVVAQPQAAAPIAQPQARERVIQPQVAAAPKIEPLPQLVRPPRKSFGELISSFLEERNLHLTELVGVLLGGLLMVGASVMFVIAYWNRLETVQTLKFSIFVGYSSIVFAAGLFVFHRWKLQATGRGLMTIGILLAPLNFLAMASSPGTLVTALVEILALGAFAWLTWLAGKALTRGGQWPLVAATIGNSALILLVGQFLGGITAPGAWMSYGLLAAGLMAGTGMWHLRQSAAALSKAGKKLENAKQSPAAAILPAINSLFLVLAVAAYCTAMSLALIVAQASRTPGMNLPSVWLLLAAPLCLAAIPALAIGLHLQRRIPDEAKLEGQRTTATMIALLGAALQAAALLFAWPQPTLLAAVGVLAAAGLACLALHYDFPAIHAGAMFAATIAYLAVFYVLADQGLRTMQSGSLLIASDKLGPYLMKLALSARSGTALGGMFVAFALLSEFFARRGRAAHGAMYVGGSCVVAVLGLALVAAHGWIGDFADGVRAAILYGLYGAVCVLLSFRGNRKLLSYIGGNLVAAAPFWLLHSISLAAWKNDLALAGCLSWVAAVWLALAWRHRNAVLLALQQIVLYLAGSLAALAWLLQRGWIATANLPGELARVDNLQVFGVALAALSLAWLVVRIVMRGNERMQKLLNPTWLPLDKIVACLLVVLQAFLLVPFIFRGVWHEIRPSGAIAQLQDYCGTAAWLFLILLAVYIIAALWERWEKSHILCGLLLAASVPCLIAGNFAAQAANASALRWGWAAMFLLLSAAIWFRTQLHKGLLAAGAKFDLDANPLLVPTLPRGNAIPRRSGVAEEHTNPPFPTDASDAGASAQCVPTPERGNEGLSSALLARIATAALTAVPVVAITVFMAVVQLTGTAPRGPAAGSLFANFGPSVSYLVPLLLVIAGTVGHALRESSAWNAFMAGLVVELAVMLGYPLHLSTSTPARKFGTAEFMVWIQLMTITAAAWAIAWMIARLWVRVWREEPAKVSIANKYISPSSLLMNVEVGFGALGNVVLLGIALFEVIFLYPLAPLSRLPQFAAAEGMPLGWAALILTLAAGALRAWQRGRKFGPAVVGLTGMSALALLACTLPNLPLPEGLAVDGRGAYRVLMIGWACYALLIAAAAWWVAAQRTLPGAEGPPQALLRLAAVWVRVAAIAAAFMGLKAGFLHENLDSERLWAAAGIAVAATAGAAMAVWRRREGWAFCAALGANVAASLVVWHVEEMRQLAFGEWWVRLVQANLIASSAVALVWLAAHRRLYQLRDWSVRQSPLLGLQIALPLAALAAILAIPVLSLLQYPQRLPVWMHDFADGPGWLSLLLAAAAAGWYSQRALPGRLLHVLACFGLAAGVLVACRTHAFPSAAGGDWLEYRLLFCSWAAAAGVLLAISFAAHAWRPAALAKWKLPLHFPAGAAKIWISALSLLAAALVARSCAEDVGGVYWSLAAVAGLSIAAGIVAVWLRSAEHVVFSGLLLNLAGLAAWFAWGERNVADFLQYQVICLAAAAAIWTLLDIAHRDLAPHLLLTNGSRPIPFAHVAITTAIFFLAVPAAYGVLGDLNGFSRDALGKLDWIALASVAGILALMLWDRRAGYAWLGLYATGIVAVAMAWRYKPLAPDMICWRAGSDLAAYALFAALIGRFISAIRRCGRYLLVPDGENRWAGGWFPPLQAALVAAVALLCVWLAVDFRFSEVGREIALFGFGGRTTGATGLLMLLGATILMAAQSRLDRREYWQYAAFAVGLLFMASIRWAALAAADPTVLAAPWLHRSIALLLSAAMMCLLAAFGLPQANKRLWEPMLRALSRGPNAETQVKTAWTEAGRKILPAFAGLTLATLAVVLLQEGWLFQPDRGAPETIFEILVVAGVMAAMLALALLFALREDFDPLKLGANGRQAYVYAAEVLVVLIGLHIWLTKPHLFQFGIVKKYWMFLLMAVAFAGAGLSEIFHRRKLPVLSLPLERTAMWLPLAPALGFWFLAPRGMNWGLIGPTPWLWFLIGGFYGTLAYLRRSWICGALAVFAANVGLWTALALGNLSFREHPQLWLIPVALCALVAEYLNRKRLSKTQSTAFRYAALSTIYISSTAEMFIAGIGQNFWLPLVLMALAVAGALLGVWLRIRSFLILGIVFLVIDIVALIRYAAVDLEQTWLWYVSFIALGAAIIAVFAFFEKRRNDVRAAIEELEKVGSLMSEDEAPMTNDERCSEIDRRAAGGDPRPPKPPPLQFGIKALLGMMVAVGVIFGTLRWIGAAEQTSYLVLGILLVSLPAAAALMAVIARIGGDDE